MNIIFKMLLFMVVSFSLVGCSTKYTYERVTESIVRCQTTENDIRALYGKPLEVGVQSGYKRLTWLDRWNSVAVFVFINDKGVVVDYALKPVGSVEIIDKCSP